VCFRLRGRIVLRVMMCLSRYYPDMTGPARNAFILSRFLSEKGFEVHVITHKSPASTRHEMIDRNHYVHRVPCPVPYAYSHLYFWYSTIALFKEAADIARKYPPDLFHSHQITTPSIAGYLFKRFRKVRSILKYGGDLVFNYLAACITDPKTGMSPDRSRIGVRLATRAQRQLFETYDHVYAVTHFGITKLQRYGVPQERMSLIHNCVDLTHFRAAMKSGSTSAERLVMTGGRHVRHKGIENAIQAFQMIRRSVPELSMAVTGSGPETQRLRKAAGQAVSKVHFLGTVSDERLRDCYASAELFLYMPYGCDGLDNVILESLASGTPVIGYDFPHVRDGVRTDYNGYLVEPGDLKSLVRHAVEILGDSRKLQSLSVNARKTVEEEFSPKLMSTRVLSLYETLLFPGD
jgi:glycosyltransferase involved in cell wall biosynthesis